MVEEIGLINAAVFAFRGGFTENSNGCESGTFAERLRSPLNHIHFYERKSAGMFGST